MSEPWRKDIRAIFRGDDPAKHIRAGAADMLAKAKVNGERRDRELAAFKYTSTPTLMVQVSQVRHDPPLWRMRSVRPIVEGGQCVEVTDPDPSMLKVELRMKCRAELKRAGYFDKAEFKEQWDTARRWCAEMVIEEEPVILLRDSQRNELEWNR